MPIEELTPYEDPAAQPPSEEGDETFSTGTKLEKEWKNRIHQKLLKVMDLTLIDNLDRSVLV